MKYFINALFFLLLAIIVINCFLIRYEYMSITSFQLDKNFKVNSINYINKLKEKYNNNDIVGYLKINDNISTPIVQTNNNTYYLNHSINKEKLVTGSVFLDYQNNIEEDKKIIIYGHNNNKFDIPFKYLVNYLDGNYYEKNKYITLFTNNNTITYEIFSIYLTNDNYEYSKINFNNDMDYLNHLNYLKSKSIYFNNLDLNSNDYVITLQTCMNDKHDNLLIINGRKVDI